MTFRFLLIVASCILPTEALSAETPEWLRSVTFDRAAQDSEHLQIMSPHSGTLHAEIPAMASVTAEIARSVTIRPAGSGKVEAVLITPGQRVHRGDVLITYTNHTLHELYLQREQARAALGSARAMVAETAKAYQRGRALDGTTVSAGEVQRRQAAVQQAGAGLAAQQATMGTIAHRLGEEFTSATETIGQGERSHLVAPFDGVVQSLNTAVAANIKAGAAVAMVTDLSHVWIVASIRPQDAARLAVGGEMTVRPAGDSDAAPIASTIGTIDGMVDPATGLLRVVSIVDNRAGTLHPGEMLDARLETTRALSGLVVPSAAIQDIDGHTVVYVRQDQNTFQPHEVKVGLETDTQAVIDSDLHPGQMIVTDGSFALKGAGLLAGASGN